MPVVGRCGLVRREQLLQGIETEGKKPTAVEAVEAYCGERVVDLMV
jgi:hypothetical protein